MRRSAADTREHLLAIARDLFYRNGIRATGIDTIARSAGVAPTTLYRSFADKDDLIAAYIEREATLYKSWFTTATGGDGPAAERLVSLFEALGQQVDDAECRGCPFQMALAELHDPEAAAHLRAAEVKHWVRGQLAGLTAEVRGLGSEADGAVLADQLMLVMEGVYASVLSTAVPRSQTPALALVRQLLACGA